LDNTTLPFTIVNMTDEAVQGVAQPRPAPAPIDPQRIAETLTLARWRAAEDRIYPLVMVDPHLYQQAVTVVAAICEAVRARGLDRAGLLALDPAEVATSGLSLAALVEAALAQLVALAPLPPHPDPEGASR
jgi:hypothetical protein